MISHALRQGLNVLQVTNFAAIQAHYQYRIIETRARLGR